MLSDSERGILKAMHRLHTNQHPDLACSRLPGPDTETKRLARQSDDPRLQHMLAEAARVGWPFAYADDLYVHDRRQLEEQPHDAMLWILRDHGTHLYPTECDNSHEASYYRQVIDYWSGDHHLNYVAHPAERARYYLVTDESLTRLSAREARDAIRVRSTTPHLPATVAFD